MWTRDVVIWLLVITLAGLGARFYHLEKCALHNDEALQMNGIQTRSFAELIEHCTHVDMHPPLSYMVEKVFYRINPSVASVRSPSAILGTIAIPLTFWVFFPLLGKRRSLITAALTASSYELIWYSRELRDYMFFYAFLVAALGCFIRILQSRDRIPWFGLIAFVLANVLAVYSHFDTYFTWPVYVVLFLAWEILDKKKPSIWKRHLVYFVICGALVLLASLPTYILFAKMRSLVGYDIVRPGFWQFYKCIAPMGLGSGWPALVWLALLGLGTWRACVLGRQTAALLLGWVVTPLAGYIFILGVPTAFITNFHRYMIFLLPGFLALMALGIEQVASWIGWKTKSIVGAVCVLVVVLLIAVLAPAYRIYYSMRSCVYPFDDIRALLERLGSRGMIIDNYYELQYLRHYLPEAIHIAHPPIWNNADEFMRLNVARFVRDATLDDPLLVFYDSNAKWQSPPGTWDWLDQHFAHKVEFVNQEAKYLYERGLNLFPVIFFSKGGTQIIRIHYNDLDDLPGWAQRHNQARVIAYGGDWYHMTLMDLNGHWSHLRATDHLGTVYLWNSADNKSSAILTLALHGCAPKQKVSVQTDNQLLFSGRQLSNSPADGLDLRSQQRFSQYIPFGAALRQQGGLLNIPLALRFPFESVEGTVENVLPGINTIKVECARPEGIVLGSATCRDQ